MSKAAGIRDLSARELKGHNILAVQRFQNATRHMIEFVVRLFLNEADFAKAMAYHNKQQIKIKKYAHIIEGHILHDKLKNAHRR